MKLIAVEAMFSPGDKQQAIDAVEAQADSARAMSGCDSYQVYQADKSIAIVQKWESMEQFDAYRNSNIFAGLIAALKPLMSAPPVTTIANVDS